MGRGAVLTTATGRFRSSMPLTKKARFSAGFFCFVWRCAQSAATYTPPENLLFAGNYQGNVGQFGLLELLFPYIMINNHNVANISLVLGTGSWEL
jgi:hypothetical protein